MFEYIKINMYFDLRTESAKIWNEDGVLHYSINYVIGTGLDNIKDKKANMDCEEFVASLEKINVEKWKKRYEPKDCFILDGESWDIAYKKTDCKVIKCSGENGYPSNWKDFLKLITSVTGAKGEYL